MVSEFGDRGFYPISKEDLLSLLKKHYEEQSADLYLDKGSKFYRVNSPAKVRYFVPWSVLLKDCFKSFNVDDAFAYIRISLEGDNIGFYKENISSIYGSGRQKMTELESIENIVHMPHEYVYYVEERLFEEFLDFVYDYRRGTKRIPGYSNVDILKIG